MSEDRIVELHIYPEDCCEYCMETIHNHLDCPICGEGYAPSTAYGDLYEEDTEIGCESCGAVFRKLDPKEGWYWRSVKCVIIKTKKQPK